MAHFAFLHAFIIALSVRVDYSSRSVKEHKQSSFLFCSAIPKRSERYLILSQRNLNLQTAYSKFDRSVCTCFVLMWNLSNVNERRFHSVQKILFHTDVRLVKLKKNYLQNFLGGFVFNDPVQLTVMVAPLCGVRPFPGLMTSFFTPSAILLISLWTIPVFLANSQCRFQGQPSCALCALLFKALSDPTEKKSRKVSRDLGPKMKGEKSVFTASPLFFLWSC